MAACPEVLELQQIPELQANKVTVAFTGALLGNMFNVDSPRVTPFIKVNEKFGAMEIRYMTVFQSPQAGLRTMSLVFDKAGYPMAMVIRGFKHGKFIEEDMGFYQYEYRAFSLKGVLELIRKLPVPNF